MFSRSISLRLRADILLFIAALVWGSGFIAQRVAAEHMGVYQFNAMRYLIGGALLLPLCGRTWKANRPTLILAGVTGFVMFLGSALQQAGLESTTAGNAGFITGLYVVFIPIILAIFWKERIRWVTWTAAGIAVVGLFLLSATGASLALSYGDTLVLIGAVVWAMHVILVGLLSRRMNVFQMTVAQFVIAGLLHGGAAFVWDQQPLLANPGAWIWPVLYSSAFPIAVGFTFQAAGMKHAPTTDAALLLSLESVFAALFGYWLLAERLTAVQIVGCVLIFGAILLVQLWPKPAEEPVPGVVAEAGFD